jgi:hypothetical protein
LKGIVLDERLLDRRQLVTVGQTLDGDYLSAVVSDREGETGIHATPVEQDRAGSALPVIAALLRAGERELLTQKVEQRDPRVDRQGVIDTVDRQRDLRDYRPHHATELF